MGKRKIGEIYNKPIVDGDKNLVTNNEIHKSELSGGSSSGSTTNMVYLNLSQFKGTEGQQIKKMLIIFATDAVYKITADSELWYGPASYCRKAVDDVTTSELVLRLSINLSQKLHMLIEFDDCNTVGDALSKMGFDFNAPDSSALLITEEEFYSLN